MTTHVLILCTHNSARSVLAEAMLNHWARRFGKDLRAHSAGSAPSGGPNPHAIAVLQAAGVSTDGLRSKSWDEFAADGAPRLRVLITVCDQAAQESCPYWPGAPVKVHWGYPDPGRAPGSDEDRRRAFELTRQALGYRLLQLAQLPFDTSSDAELRAALERIGAS